MAQCCMTRLNARLSFGLTCTAAPTVAHIIPFRAVGTANVRDRADGVSPGDTTAVEISVGVKGLAT